MSNKFDENGKFARQYNTYVKQDDYYIGYTNNGEKFLFDCDDYEMIKEYCWYKDSDGYFRTNIYKDGKRTALLLHALIMGVGDSRIMADHIHGKDSRYDNRKSNLRIATRYQNNINQPNRKDNVSGVKGVNYDSNCNKWRARISVNGERINLGIFTKYENAVLARKNAEERYHGEYSYDNSIGK